MAPFTTLQSLCARIAWNNSGWAPSCLRGKAAVKDISGDEGLDAIEIHWLGMGWSGAMGSISQEETLPEERQQEKPEGSDTKPHLCV